MSRPRSRSPMRPFRSSSLYRRSPGRVGDRRDSSGLPQDAVGFNPRGPADPGRWDEWGRATHRPEFSEKHVHGSWKRTQSPSQWCDVSSFSPGVPTPSEFRDHRGGLQPEPQLGYAERRRLSPKKRFHTPSGGDSFRSRSREDFQRFQEDRAPPSPLRFSHRDTHPSRHESSLSQRAPTHEWHRAQHSGGSEPVPDRASWSSSRDSPRPKRGRSAWGEEYEVPGSVSNTEASHCSVQYHGRSPYSERCAEEPRVRHSSERRLDVRDVPSGRRRSTERAPLIVEHDHGHVNCGTSREANGERRASTCDRMHTREGPSDRYHRVGSQPYRDKTSFDRDVGSQGQPLHKRSPALSGDRCGTAPKMFPRPPRSQQFQEQLGQDSNGDVDLRRMEPVEPREMGVPHRPPIGGEQGGKVKQKKVFQKGGFRFPAAVRATPQETLTIKVDMQRPVAQNSPSCFSSDRQLSLDLVNVGRQRLDFLPKLEVSGSSRETTLHSGTFAQEIITLVHQVREDYFKGEGLTLNERFSTPQSGQSEGDSDAPNSPRIHRRIDLSQSEFKTQPMQKVGRMKQWRRQVADDPGDLRHDLERRRQERLEGVKITIPGGIYSQRPLLPGSVVTEEEEDDDDEGGHNWPEEEEERPAGHWNRETGSMGQKRTGFIRQGSGGLGKPIRPQNRHRQQARHSNSRQGSSW